MLAFERLGSGPALVLVHGVGHRRRGLVSVPDQLAEQCEPILVDLPGHGESGAGAAACSDISAQRAQVIRDVHGMFAQCRQRDHISRPSVRG